MRGAGQIGALSSVELVNALRQMCQDGNSRVIRCCDGMRSSQQRHQTFPAMAQSAAEVPAHGSQAEDPNLHKQHEHSSCGRCRLLVSVSATPTLRLNMWCGFTFMNSGCTRWHSAAPGLTVCRPQDVLTATTGAAGTG